MRALTVLALLAAGPALGQDLTGTRVGFQVITWDTPDEVLYATPRQSVTVGEGPEIGLEAEGRQEGFDVIPLTVDISATRIDISYASAGAGDFYDGTFNGYVFLLPPCPQVYAAGLDQETTTLSMDPDRVQLFKRRIMVNVSGLSATPDDRIGVVLKTTACPE